MAFTLPKPMLPLVRLPRPRGTGGNAILTGSPRPSSAPKSVGVPCSSASSEVANTGLSAEKEVDEKPDGQVSGDQKRTVTISGLPMGITDDELRELCSVHGTVVWNMSDKRNGPSGRVATVRFKDSEGARQAVELMHGSAILGATLSVEIATLPAAAARAQRQHQATKSRAVCRDSASVADTEPPSPGAVNRKRRLDGSEAAAYSGAEASRTKASHTTGHHVVRSVKPVAGPIRPPARQSDASKEASSVTTNNDETDIFNDEFFARVDEKMSKCLDAKGKVKDQQGSTAFPPEPPQEFSGAIDPTISEDGTKPSSRALIRRARPDGPCTAKPDGPRTTKPDGPCTAKPDGPRTTKPGLGLLKPQRMTSVRPPQRLGRPAAGAYVTRADG